MQSLVSSKSQSWLVWFFKGLLVLAFLVLVTRLSELQIIKGAYYKSLSDNNRIRRVPIAAARGNIYAKGGEVLVKNKDVQFTIDFTPQNGFQKLHVNDDTPADEILTESQR
jgi:cell division protein FtsI/penicillin-binding protein 2